MSEQTVYFYPAGQPAGNKTASSVPRIEPATCTEAESFVLRVLDDSMEPEFRKGCMIVIDPTGRATDGSYVLAHRPQSDCQSPSDTEVNNDDGTVGEYVFRQLHRSECTSPVATDDPGITDNKGSEAYQWTLKALNPKYNQEIEAISLDAIVGVIVQRAGVRRSYHKRYD